MKPKTKPTAKAGRKSLYTPDMHKRIVDALATGVSVRDACAFAGITETTFFEWVKAKPEFAEATTRARSEGRIGAAAIVRRAAINGDVDAAQWYLERTDPMNWGRTTKVIMDVDPHLQKRLNDAAKERGIDLSAVFEAMLNEFAVAAHDSEE